LSRHSPRAQAAPAFAIPHSAFRNGAKRDERHGRQSREGSGRALREQSRYNSSDAQLSTTCHAEAREGGSTIHFSSLSSLLLSSA
jgi:hypothetical protein